MKLIRIVLTICLTTAGVPLIAQAPDPNSGVRLSTEGARRLSLNLPEADLRGSRLNASRPPASALAPIAQSKRSGHWRWGTIAGVVAGGAVGYVTAIGILASDVECQPHCGHRVAAAGAGFVGFPILGGLIGRALSKAP